MTRGRAWTEQELVLALDVYCRMPFGRLHRTNPEIMRLASRLGRTPGAVGMKCCNFASLDPAEQARGIRGLTGASDLDKRVFARYSTDLVALQAACESVLVTPASEPELARPRKRDLDSDAARLAEVATVECNASLRVNRPLSALFRTVVLVSYEGRCAICSIDAEPLIDAAHIIPWNEGGNTRLDPRNGVALCSLHHRAFDCGLISVSEYGRVITSTLLERSNPSVVHRAALMEISGAALRRPVRFEPMADAFVRHRTTCYKG